MEGWSGIGMVVRHWKRLPQGRGGVTIPRRVWKVSGCVTSGHGSVVALAVLGECLDFII